MQFFLSVYQLVTRNLKKKLLKRLDKIRECCIFAALFDIKQNNNNNNDNNSNNKKNKKKMKSNRKQTIAKIKKVEYRNTSLCGNNSYYIAFENEKGELIIGYTKPNADCAVGCRNEDLKEFAYIEYHTTKSGKIVIDYIFNKSTYEMLFANQK